MTGATVSTPPTRPPIVSRRQSFAPGFIAVTPRTSHLVVIKLSRSWIDCRIADRHLQHETCFGSVAILPSGADCSALVDRGTAQTVTLSIDDIAFASFVDRDSGQCEPRDVLRGHDMHLAELALSLARVAPRDFISRGKLAHDAMTHITTRYTRPVTGHSRGLLAPSALQAVRDFIFANVAGELSIAQLAAIAQLSPYHFSRAFTRTTGVSPHRYIMQARADQAAASIRVGQQSLAEVAYAHGFTDQSHMCRWIQRRYNATPTSLRGATAIG